jgi:hypothetical protein
MRVGRDEAANYDLVTAGQANTSLSDAMSLRGCTRTHVSFDMIHAGAMLEATLLVRHMMFGSDHPLVISASSFMMRYNSDRLAIQHRLTSHGTSHYESKFVRYFGLRLANWFHRMESSPVLIGAPDFEQIFDRLEVDDPTWCPSLPVAYLAPTSPVGVSQAAVARGDAASPSALVAPAPAPAATPAATSAPAPAPATDRARVETVQGPPVVPEIGVFAERISNCNVTKAIVRGGELPLSRASAQPCACAAGGTYKDSASLTAGAPWITVPISLKKLQRLWLGVKSPTPDG